MTEGINRTVHKLRCCATPGGCNDCEDRMDTTGCGTRLYKEAEVALEAALTEIKRLKHALAKVDIDCAYCAHKDENAKACIEADCECERCTADDCTCRKCRKAPGREWTWNGGEGT